jgi:hypothetical protein
MIQLKKRKSWKAYCESVKLTTSGSGIVLIPFEHGATFGHDAMNLGALFAVSSSSSSSYMNGRRLKRQKIQTTQPRPFIIIFAALTQKTCYEAGNEILLSFLGHHPSRGEHV